MIRAGAGQETGPFAGGVRAWPVGKGRKGTSAAQTRPRHSRRAPLALLPGMTCVCFGRSHPFLATGPPFGGSAVTAGSETETGHTDRGGPCRWVQKVVGHTFPPAWRGPPQWLPPHPRQVSHIPIQPASGGTSRQVRPRSPALWLHSLPKRVGGCGLGRRQKSSGLTQVVPGKSGKRHGCPRGCTRHQQGDTRRTNPSACLQAESADSSSSLLLSTNVCWSLHSVGQSV